MHLLNSRSMLSLFTSFMYAKTLLTILLYFSDISDGLCFFVAGRFRVELGDDAQPRQIRNG